MYYASMRAYQSIRVELAVANGWAVACHSEVNRVPPTPNKALPCVAQ